MKEIGTVGRKGGAFPHCAAAQPRRLIEWQVEVYGSRGTAAVPLLKLTVALPLTLGSGRGIHRRR